jgi:hypothetical protein
MDSAPIIGVCPGPGHSVLTAAGETGIATVPGCAGGCPRWPDEGRPVIASLDQVSFTDATEARRARRPGAPPRTAPVCT